MSREQEISFKMIANVGTANAFYIGAVSEAKKGNTEEVRKLLQKGESCYRDSHRVHSELIMKMAGGENVEIDMILIHAEDQLMNAEVIKLMAEQVIDLCDMVYSLKERVEASELYCT